MNKKGFTILEILVVLAVLAILIGIAVPRIKGMQDQANIQKAKSELKTLQTAIVSYYINNSNAYPASSNTICASTLNALNPKIVAAPLYDPFAATGTEYKYLKSTDGLYYIIISVGPGTAPTISALTDGGAAVTGNLNGGICVTNGTVAGCI